MVSMSSSAPNVSSTFTFGEFGGSCFAGGQSSNGATAVASAVAVLRAAIRPMVASVAASGEEGVHLSGLENGLHGKQDSDSAC